MSISGMSGKVYWIDSECPTFDCSSGWAVPQGAATCWTDEVTGFTFDESVYTRRYGHDKSKGCQDVCTGIWGGSVSIDANIVPGSTTQPRRAGRTCYLELWPIGFECGAPIGGFAVIERVSRRVRQETGEPYAYSMTLATKGPWAGIGNDDNMYGGHECVECTSGQ